MRWIACAVQNKNLRKKHKRGHGTAIRTNSKACKWVAAGSEHTTINDKLRLAAKQSNDTTNGPKRTKQ